MIKLISAKAFCVAIDVDEEGRILNTPIEFSKFINLNISVLEGVLKRNKFQKLTIEDVEET